MKNNLLLSLFVIFACVGCKSPSYLPSSDAVPSNPYGSFISISFISAPSIKGELIAIDSTFITVLPDKGTCVVSPLSDIYQFKLSYAKQRAYWRTIPLFTLATISHGWLLGLTAPINLLVTITVTATGSRAFTFNKSNISYDNVRMYARFPQGIPGEVDLASIRRPEDKK